MGFVVNIYGIDLCQSRGVVLCYRTKLVALWLDFRYFV